MDLAKMGLTENGLCQANDVCHQAKDRSHKKADIADGGPRQYGSRQANDGHCRGLISPKMDLAKDESLR